MEQHWNLAVEKLQHEVIDALQSAAGRRIDGIARQLVQLGLDPADDPIQPPIGRGVRGARQQRRHELVVEQHVLVADFEHPRNPDAHVSGLAGLAQFEREPGIDDIDLLLDPQRRGGIDEGLGAANVTAGAVGTGLVNLARIRRRHRHHQPNDLAGCGFGDIDGVGDRAVGGDVERRAVRHHAGGATNGEFALLGQVRVDLELREAPGIRRDIAHALLQQMFEIAVVLLQMMRPQKQTFGPENLAVPGHSTIHSKINFCDRRLRRIARHLFFIGLVGTIVIVGEVQHESIDRRAIVPPQMRLPAQQKCVPELALVRPQP